MNNDIYECSKCGKSVEKNKVCIVDDSCICAKCMYENAAPFEIYPIGIVRNNLQRGHTGFGLIGKGVISRIELISTQKPFMYKIEDEKFLTVVYYFHTSRSVRSVFNRGLDGKMVGVFASRTPDRLSKIGISNVKLIKVENTTLFVKDLDAIDGSPVLDIKLNLK